MPTLRADFQNPVSDTLRLLAACLVAAVIVAGCGTSKSSSDATFGAPVVDYDTVYLRHQVDRPPEIVDIRRDIMKQTDYPDEAKDQGIEGRVYVQFVVSPEGEVTNLRLDPGVHPLLDQEALRVYSDVEFRPGIRNGTPVPVRMRAPVTFQQNYGTTFDPQTGLPIQPDSTAADSSGAN